MAKFALKIFMLAHIIFINETMITPLIKNIIISSTAINFGFFTSARKTLSGMLIIAINPRNISW